jgi:hypothetical protein
VWLGVACSLGMGMACGGNSSRHGNDARGSSALSGAGGAEAGTGATAGANGSARGGGAGAGAQAAGTGGEPSAGTSGSSMSGAAGGATTLGGAGGSSAGMTGGGAPAGGAGTGATSGESSAGAAEAGAGACLDLCKPDAPACCTEPLRCMSGVPSCRIDVLADRVDPQYEYADLVEKVAALSDDIAVAIGDAEIAKAAVDPYPAARIELELTPQASATHGPALMNLLNHPFRFACDGQELFIGVVYIREGAAGLGTPVLHVEYGDDTIRLLLGASEGAWTGLGGSADATKSERLDRPELRATLCERGILSELE